jgi:hypothetical protein
MAERGFRAWFQLYGGLACALAFMVCGVAAVTLDAPQPLRGIAAAGMVLWAPGFVLTLAFFVPGAIGGLERALLAFAASVALTIIPAIVLEAGGVRIEMETFLVTACVVTSLAAVLALLRLRRPADLSAFPPAWRPPGVPIATTGSVAVLAICIAVILASAWGIARITPEPTGIRGSSAFAVTSTDPRSMRAEVISAELEDTTYRLTMSTGAGVTELARFTLAPGGSWRQVLRRPRGDGVELFLYRRADRLPYRKVVLPEAPA